MTKTLTQVRETRNLNTPAIFNIEAALKALKTTPAKVHASGTLGAISDAIVNCINQAGRPLAINQIVAMLTAGGLSVTSKQVSDKAWALAGNTTDKDPAKKQAKFEQRRIEKLGGGMYGPRA